MNGKFTTLIEKYNYKGKDYKIVQGSDKLLRAINYDYLDEEGELTTRLLDIQMFCDPADNTIDGIIARINYSADFNDYLRTWGVDITDKGEVAKASRNFYRRYHRKYVPVYTGEWEISADRGLYAEIVEENKRFNECATEFICCNETEPEVIVKELTKEFGYERTALLTALNIVTRSLSDCFSSSIRSWASQQLSHYHANSDESLLRKMIEGGQLDDICSAELARFADTFIPEYEKHQSQSDAGNDTLSKA